MKPVTMLCVRSEPSSAFADCTTWTEDRCLNLEATSAAEIISTEMRDAYELYEPLTHVHNDSGITSDYLSQLVATLLQAVNTMRKSRAENALSLSYGLVLELASLSIQFLGWRNTLRLGKVAMGDMFVGTLHSYCLVQCFKLSFARPECGTVRGWLDI